MSAVRWVIALGAAVLVVCLLVLARGQEHHRGDDIGTTRVVTNVAAGAVIGGTNFGDRVSVATRGDGHG